jgi:hypothetical protein
MQVSSSLYISICLPVRTMELNLEVEHHAWVSSSLIHKYWTKLKGSSFYIVTVCDE